MHNHPFIKREGRTIEKAGTAISTPGSRFRASSGYVACLAAYNNGISHGRWIDALQDSATILEEIEAMLKASPIADADEFTIHSH